MTLIDDRYDVLELLGAGGAARVHRGRDVRLDRPVAVKLLGDDLARSADPAGRRRFLAEAQSAAAFDHPNIVTVYDAGEADGQLYIVMEHVDGPNLGAVLAERGPLPEEQAVSVAIQVLHALAAAHAAGIVHRDVKPSNVLIGPDGRARLTDFGIAKRFDEIEEALTAAGSAVGTPQYLAPEQATGRDVGAPTDVYLVGVLLDELLTGRRTAGATGPLVATDAVDPSELVDGLDRRTIDAVRRATHPDPRHRFPDARSMAVSLAGRVDPPLAPVAVDRVDGGRDTAPRTATMAMPAAPAATISLPVAGATVVMGAADSPGDTAVLAPITPDTGVDDPDGAGAPRRRIWWVATVVLLLLLAVGIIANAGGDPEPAPPTTTVAPAASSTTVPAAVTETTEPAPAAVDDGGGNGGGNGGANGNGGGKKHDNGNGKGKKNR